MATQSVASITCPNCQNTFSAPVQRIIDAQENPEAKSRLLTGYLNVVVCPYCGSQGGLNVPFLYHDAELELAFVYAPLEVGATDAERQKVIGNLTNALLQKLSPEERKGYLLQPRTFISLQSMTEAILEEDEETREQVETQRRKMALLDELRQIDPDDTLAVSAFVGANDKELDEMFFQLLNLVIDFAESQDNVAELERLTRHRETLMDKSTTGQMFQAQQVAVEALAADPTRETLLEQLIEADAESVRQALVMVGRQLLDYAFFQALTSRIDAAPDKATKEELVNLRKEIQEIRDDVDAMAAAVMDARGQLLQELMTAQNPRELVLQRLPELDQTFFTVLNLNIREAANQGLEDVVQRLRTIGDIVIGIMDELAPPEIRLVNRIASAEDDEAVRQILEQEREQLDQDLAALLEHTAQDLQAGGHRKGAQRLRYAVEQIEAMVAA